MEPPESQSQISERVRVELARRNISGSELARRLGETQSYVSRRIRGKVPWRASDLTRIATTLDVPLDSLLPAEQTAQAS